MSIIVLLVLLVVIFLLAQELISRIRYIKKLHDAIQVADNATGLVRRLTVFSTIYYQADVTEPKVDLKEAIDAVANVAKADYSANFGDVGALNDLAKYQLIGNAGIGAPIHLADKDVRNMDALDRLNGILSKRKQL